MATSHKKKNKKWIDLNRITYSIMVLGAISLILTTYFIYYACTNDRKLLSVSLLALFGGLLFESFRIAKDWKAVIGRFVTTCFFSLVAFLPGKRETGYDFEAHMKIWPYFFLIIFAVITAVFNKEKTITKLNEGITLLHSLALIYWTVNAGFPDSQNWLLTTVFIAALLLSLFSILHALTYIPLTTRSRLALSIWSTIVMFAFALNTFFGVLSNTDMEEASSLPEALNIGLQYFFLGVSAVYTVQHYLLLEAFLPSKSGNYIQGIREIKKDHLGRYSDKQVPVLHAVLCVLFSLSVYGLNYRYQLLPGHTMIWIVFLVFPVMSFLADWLTGQKKTPATRVKLDKHQ